MKTIILDASAIINGLPSGAIAEQQVTTPAVMDEVQEKRWEGILKLAFDIEKIEVRLPTEEKQNEILALMQETKDKLSDTDVQLLALTLELSQSEVVAIATDDYGIQNIAKKIGLKFIPVGEEGIKKVISWQYYCPACRKKYDKEGSCEVCGTALKRKPR
jgi:UPF0271 protein